MLHLLRDCVSQNVRTADSDHFAGSEAVGALGARSALGTGAGASHGGHLGSLVAIVTWLICVSFKRENSKGLGGRCIWFSRVLPRRLSQDKAQGVEAVPGAAPLCSVTSPGLCEARNVFTDPFFPQGSLLPSMQVGVSLLCAGHV